MEPKYPDIQVQLSGEDGNAFAIMGKIMKALAEADVSVGKRSAYQIESMSGDYNHVLTTAMRWVTVL